MLHIIWSIIVGFIVGWLAEVLYPGAQHLGFWKAALIGIGGSILGGLISRLFSKPEPGSSFHAAGFFKVALKPLKDARDVGLILVDQEFVQVRATQPNPISMIALLIQLAAGASGAL